MKVIILIVGLFLLTLIFLHIKAFVFAFKNNGVWGVIRMFFALLVHAIFLPLSKK